MLVLFPTRFAHLRRDLLSVYLEMKLVFVVLDAVVTFYRVARCSNRLFPSLAFELGLSVPVTMIWSSSGCYICVLFWLCCVVWKLVIPLREVHRGVRYASCLLLCGTAILVAGQRLSCYPSLWGCPICAKSLPGCNSCVFAFCLTV